MDFLRRMLGLGPFPQQPGDFDQFYNDHHPYNDQPPYSDDPSYPQEFSEDFQTFFDSFEESIHIMNKLFQHQMPSMRVYGELDESASSSSPRDQMLKSPDTELNDSEQQQPTLNQPNNTTPFTNDGDPASGSRELNDFFHSRRSGGMVDAFRMLDGLFGVPLTPPGFHNRPNTLVPYDAETSPDPHECPRDAMLKKQDQDLDKQSDSSSISALLKDGPGYSYGPDDPRSNSQSGDLLVQQQPTMKRSFTSTSVQRIVRPDGSIEERRTYRDSSGKEEVTVTQIDPQSLGPLVPHDGPFRRGGGGFESIFGGLFR